MKRLLLSIMALVLLVVPSKADEGMWIPMLLKKYNIEQMQEMGFKLTAEDIYSVNQASLKDAVVIFGRGCTGELVSDQGLLITNHHCGYSQIQYHSSVEHDYLTNGFWAMSADEELINPGLTATFLKRMEDVTEQVFSGIEDNMSEAASRNKINENISRIKEEAVKGTHYQAVLKPFFNGNQYFLFINEVFKDVRLVGAPPSAIGKFGGDTDNWMWPRHTGDFSVFRIYAGKDNKPAEYSADNVPYHPAKHFQVSMKGVEEGDFTMVFGYPGSTYEYVPSYHLKMLTETVNPKLIDVRTGKLNILNRFQEADPAVRIQYASKNATISNSWKRWIGENRGLEILDAIHKKENYENNFKAWATANRERNAKYGHLIEQYKDLYVDYTPYRLAKDYISEMILRNGIEVAMVAHQMEALAGLYSESGNGENQTGHELEVKKTLSEKAELFYKDYYQPLDRELAIKLLSMYRDNMSEPFMPDVYLLIDKKFGGDITKYVDNLFKKTVFADKNTALSFIQGYSARSLKKLKNDPALQLYNSFIELYRDVVASKEQTYWAQISKLNKAYMAGQMAFETDKVFYPDANFTLRVAYGKVAAYKARDAVKYDYFTTLEGIMEKDNPDIYDYRVPQKLKELYAAKDYGQYEVNGTVPVCFIATNHTTGGNSGSPVLNSEGQLIGVNFDRAWEGVMSDLMFNPDQCRNITLDIRYVLFIIDKFAGAGYLVDEMELVKE